ncbi:MAG: VIT1/CCC1 family protein [Bacteroidia bacterium]|nr:VIT1/CCC1 family protein [Bacteroidia bacterium]MDW8088738.1 VIT1/CCC1 family protein [Bacteroidia bacterium]
MLEVPALHYAAEELFNAHLYEWLSQRTKATPLHTLLQLFAKQEQKHYEFWRQYLRREVSYPKWRLWWYQLLAILLGPTFVLRLLEEREHRTIEAYRRLAATLAPEARQQILTLIQEEESHEAEFLRTIQAEEPRLRYLGFIVLGLSDAIIEVTGVHAGFLGVSHKPILAGIAGLIVGFSASIAMASAAYLQAKQNPEVSPIRSAAYTGLSYLLAVLLLALPYFLAAHMGVAFWSSVCLATLLIGGFAYYSATIFNRNFRGEFLESLGVLGATSALSYGFGEALRYFFPMDRF